MEPNKQQFYDILMPAAKQVFKTQEAAEGHLNELLEKLSWPHLIDNVKAGADLDIEITYHGIQYHLSMTKDLGFRMDSIEMGEFQDSMNLKMSDKEFSFNAYIDANHENLGGNVPPRKEDSDLRKIACRLMELDKLPGGRRLVRQILKLDR